MNKKAYDLVIIGSGPAGLTAAIYGCRYGLKTVVVTGLPWGGQLINAPLVENYPGFPEGILGFELMKRMKKQVENLGAVMIEDIATNLLTNKRPFTVSLKSGRKINGKSIIIATGRSPQMLGVRGEKRLHGKGVSVCATCDAAFYKNKVVAVVGGGDTATTDAILLSKFASRVYIIHRRDQLRAAPTLANEVKANPKIEIKWNKIVKEIKGESKVESLILQDTTSCKKEKIPVDGVFIAIGSKPNTEWLKGTINLDKNGYIDVKGGNRTSVEGVFAAGDVVANMYNQAITSAADGCKAALQAQEWLMKERQTL